MKPSIKIMGWVVLCFSIYAFISIGFEIPKSTTSSGMLQTIVSETSSITPTPSTTSTTTPTPTPTSTATPTPTATSTPTPSSTPTPVPTPIEPPGFFTIQTPNDLFELAVFFLGIAIIFLSIFAPPVLSPIRQSRFIIADFQSNISEGQKENIVRISLPAVYELFSERVYFLVRFGSKLLPANVRKGNSLSRHHIILRSSNFPLIVRASLYMGNEIVGETDVQYSEQGIQFWIAFISPPARNYRWKMSLRFESHSGNSQEINFDSNITVNRFLGLTASQISFYNFLGVILGLIMALLGVVLRTP